MDANNNSMRTIYYGLEAPVPVMLLETTEWMIIMGGFGIGIVMKQLILGAIFGYVGFKIYRKMKGVGKRGAVLHKLWRLGLPIDPLLKTAAPKPTAVIFHE